MESEIKTSDITPLNYQDMPVEVLKAYLVENGIKFGANSGAERIKTLVHEHLIENKSEEAPAEDSEATGDVSDDESVDESPSEPDFDESPVGADAIIAEDEKVPAEKPSVVTSVSVFDKFGNYQKTFTRDVDGINFVEKATRYAGQIGGGNVK